MVVLPWLSQSSYQTYGQVKKNKLLRGMSKTGSLERLFNSKVSRSTTLKKCSQSYSKRCMRILTRSQGSPMLRWKIATTGLMKWSQLNSGKDSSSVITQFSWSCSTDSWNPASTALSAVTSRSLSTRTMCLVCLSPANQSTKPMWFATIRSVSYSLSFRSPWHWHRVLRLL